MRRRGLTKESRFGKEMGAGSIAAEHYRDQSTSSSQLSTTTTQDADHVTVSKWFGLAFTDKNVRKV